MATACDDIILDARSDCFRRGLSRCVAEAERYAVAEVRRLNVQLLALQAENEQLKRKLGADGPSCGSGVCGPSAVRPIVPESRPRAPLSSQPAFTSKIVGEDVRAGSKARAGSKGPVGDSISEASLAAVMSMTQREMQMTAVPTGNQTKHRLANLAVREMLSRKSVQGSQHKRTALAQTIVRSQAFEYGTLCAVVLNAIWIALDLDLNGRPFQHSPLGFQLVENAFIIIFAAEMLARFLAFENKRSALWDYWFLFDSLLVLMMLLECWIFSFIFWLAGDTLFDKESFGALSLLRILRMLRVARVVRICRMIPELRTMLEGMLAGIRSVLITAGFLIAITYTFAIFLRQLGISTDWGKEFFGTVPQSIYTLVISSMLPDNAALLDAMGRETWFCAAIYFLFLVLTAITVMNMLIAILCDVIFRVSQEETERHSIDSMGTKLKAILTTIDKDFDDKVSKAEFQSILENERAIRALVDVGVDVGAMVSDADFIFGDAAKEGLPFEEFKEEVLKFRINSSATHGTVSAIRCSLTASLDTVVEKLGRLENLVLSLYDEGNEYSL